MLPKDAEETLRVLQVVAGIQEQLPTHDYIFGRLLDLSHTLECVFCYYRIFSFQIRLTDCLSGKQGRNRQRRRWEGLLSKATPHRLKLQMAFKRRTRSDNSA